LGELFKRRGEGGVGELRGGGLRTAITLFKKLNQKRAKAALESLVFELEKEEDLIKAKHQQNRHQNRCNSSSSANKAKTKGKNRKKKKKKEKEDDCRQ